VGAATRLQLHSSPLLLSATARWAGGSSKQRIDGVLSRGVQVCTVLWDGEVGTGRPPAASRQARRCAGTLLRGDVTNRQPGRRCMSRHTMDGVAEQRVIAARAQGGAGGPAGGGGGCPAATFGAAVPAPSRARQRSPGVGKRRWCFSSHCRHPLGNISGAGGWRAAGTRCGARAPPPPLPAAAAAAAAAARLRIQRPSPGLRPWHRRCGWRIHEDSVCLQHLRHRAAVCSAGHKRPDGGRWDLGPKPHGTPGVRADAAGRADAPTTRAR
jgi:hypothetical protein